MEYGTNARSNPHNHNKACNFKPFAFYFFLKNKLNLMSCKLVTTIKTLKIKKIN